MDSSSFSRNIYIELIMTDYKAIKGKTIQSVASDIDNAEGEGQIWFNTTSGDYKTIVKAAGTWSTGGTMNTARWEGPGGFGTSTAAFAIGGYIPPGSYGAVVESWNGSSWTETTDLNTARAQMASTGLTTAGIVAGGFSPPTTAKTESWNGSSWTEVNDMSTARYGPGYGTGTGPTNLLFSGGYTTTDVANTEEWTAAEFEIKSVTQS